MRRRGSGSADDRLVDEAADIGSRGDDRKVPTAIHFECTALCFLTQKRDGIDGRACSGKSVHFSATVQSWCASLYMTASAQAPLLKYSLALK